MAAAVHPRHAPLQISATTGTETRSAPQDITS